MYMPRERASAALSATASAMTHAWQVTAVYVHWPAVAGSRDSEMGCPQPGQVSSFSASHASSQPRSASPQSGSWTVVDEVSRPSAS